MMDASQLDCSAPIEPRPAGCAVPVTAEQRRLYEVLRRTDPENKPLNVRMCASATRIAGPLNADLLQDIIRAVMWRHESLRTRFTVNGTRQHIDAPRAYELPIVNLSELPHIEAEREARRLAQDFQEQKIDLSVGPLFEALLFKLPAQQHVLILLIDHMVSDGISNALLSKEIWTAYDAAERRMPAPLPTLPLQFADYAVWQQRTHESWKREHEAYWSEHLATAKRATIPAASGPQKARPANGVTVHYSFGAALSDRLRELGKREQTSTSNVALTIYAVAMSHWCGQEDLLIRCPVHGRHGRPELENVIGFIANRLYLRVRVSGPDTLLDLVAQVRHEMKCALEHRDFDRVPEFVPECLATEPEFHWRSVNWPGRPANSRQDAMQQIRRQPFLVRLPSWPWKFWSIFDDTPAGICATVHYWPHLLKPDEVASFGSNLLRIAEVLVDRPRARVDSEVTHETH